MNHYKTLTAAFALLSTPFALHAGDSHPALTSDVEHRVAELLSKLTLEEKIDLIGGVDSFYVRPVTRLNLPKLKMSDGPIGTRNDGPSTAYPAGIALAASWDTDLAERFGASMGRDSRARGVHFLLGPAMDLYRVPVCGRNAEYFGEDPLLSGKLAAAVTRGIQSQGVVATIKHFAGNEQEHQRNTINSQIDERTLRELYLRQFEIAVKEGNPWASMCAYNKVNGTYCSANDFLQNQVLKSEWGFAGIEMSDWGATHDALGAATGGLDLEMPGPKFMNRENLLPPIKDGKLKESTIDDKVRRILRVTLANDFDKRDQKDPSIPLDDPQSRTIALAMAREGTVLLKNEHELLPLDRAKIKTIALLGPCAHPAVTGCGGSSHIQPINPVSIRDGLTAVGGAAVHIVHVPWAYQDQVVTLAKTCTYEGGLSADFFPNRTLKGKPALSRKDARIDFDWGNAAPAEKIGPTDFSVRWKGQIKPATSGPHLLAVTSDDGARVFVDGKRLINSWGTHQSQTATAVLPMEAGHTYDLRVEYFNAAGNANVSFGWGPLPPVLSDEARKQVAAADVAVVCAGFNASQEGEGSDRSYSLPDAQDDLIRAVADANPKTVVILTSGGNVDQTAWADKVPALLHAWFPGSEGGRALAEILFGDTNPSGKLPASFEAKWDDCPAAQNYPGDNGTVEYKEGLFMGYRGFDKSNTTPRFPFGHGLSYTTFALSDLKVTKTSPDTYDVTLNVQNTGKRPGSEVVQLYVGESNPAQPRPVRELKAFSRVTLPAGQSQTVHLSLDRSSFAYYDVDRHTWTVDDNAQFEISAGTSSRDLPLKATLAPSH